MTPEAIALHYLDNLDAKIHAFTREIRDDPSRESSWTPFQQNLGRRLFKGSPNADGGRRRTDWTPDTASRTTVPSAPDACARRACMNDLREPGS